MGRVDRNWTKSGGRPSPMAGGFVSGLACASPTQPGNMTFRVAISTEPDPQGTGGVDIHPDPYTTAACAAGVERGPLIGTAHAVAIVGSEGRAS